MPAPLPSCPLLSALVRLPSAAWLKSWRGAIGQAASDPRETSFSSGLLVLGDSWGAADHVKRKTSGINTKISDLQ